MTITATRLETGTMILVIADGDVILGTLREAITVAVDRVDCDEDQLIDAINDVADAGNHDEDAAYALEVVAGSVLVLPEELLRAIQDKLDGKKKP